MVYCVADATLFRVVFMFFIAPDSTSCDNSLLKFKNTLLVFKELRRNNDKQYPINMSLAKCLAVHVIVFVRC